MNTPPLLQACLNGARPASDHPALPLSPNEIAADARRAQIAGATALHVHPRTNDGQECLSAAVIGETMLAIRRAVPGMPAGVATGAWVEPDPGLRHAAIREWGKLAPDARPDYASVNLSEDGADMVIGALVSMGIGVEAGVWSLADAARFVTADFRNQTLRCLIEMQTDDGAEAAETYAEIRTLFDAEAITTPLLLHGEGGSVWPMVQVAVRDGLSTRVGLEDGLLMPNGLVARDNAELIAAARQMIEPTNGE